MKIPVIDYSFTEYYVPSPWVTDKIKLIPVRDTLPW